MTGPAVRFPSRRPPKNVWAGGSIPVTPNVFVQLHRGCVPIVMVIQASGPLLRNFSSSSMLAITSSKLGGVPKTITDMRS